LLEVLLQSYSGTLFLVSHDREFLDNIVTQVIAFEGDGMLKEYAGGYEDWVRSKDKSSPKPAERQRNGKTAPAVPPGEMEESRSPKLGYKETRELEEPT
jgi:ATP-binding cassette subfamily F protein uup